MYDTFLGGLHQNAAICAQGRSPPPGRHTFLVVSHTLNSVQLYEMAEANVNILGLTALIGNTKRVLNNARGYLNWLRITIPPTSSGDYEKTELTLVPGCPSLLQLTYLAIPTAITKDFKLIEVQMEVEFYDSNENKIMATSQLRKTGLCWAIANASQNGECHQEQMC